MRILLKTSTVALFGILVISFQAESTQQQGLVGESIFNNHCASCHVINKTTKNGPSFQYIRQDYGLEWTIAFIKERGELIKKRNLNALYSVALYYPIKHNNFPFLKKPDIISILDYVDKFKYDSTQTTHRRHSFERKKEFVEEFEKKHKF